jgi:hypothetical protein
MASVKISEFRGPGVIGNVATQAPLLPELRVTVLDTTSATSLKLLAETGLVSVTSDTAIAMSGLGAISGSNLGVGIAVAPAEAFFCVRGGITLSVTAG